jgi:hypothetical protein
MTIQILGIQFFKGKTGEVFTFLKNKGGLLTVPAAPALVTIARDKDYYDALLESDIVIPDSGYMILIWNTFFKNKINKISGLEFINFFVENIHKFKDDTFFLVNPSDVDGKSILSGEQISTDMMTIRTSIIGKELSSSKSLISKKTTRCLNSILFSK